MPYRWPAFRGSSPRRAFSVNYPAPNAAYQVTTRDDGVTAKLTAGDGGVLRLFSQPADGRVARQVVRQLIDKQYPNAEIAYELPNAHVGYQLGYGVVADFQPTGVSTNYQLRVIIMAAVKDDLALIAVAEGPFRRFTPTSGRGRRPAPTSRSPWTWPSTSKASAGRAIRSAETGPSRNERQ